MTITQMRAAITRCNDVIRSGASERHKEAARCERASLERQIESSRLRRQGKPVSAFDKAMAEHARGLLVGALGQHRSIPRAAAALGLAPSTMRVLMARYGVPTQAAELLM